MVDAGPNEQLALVLGDDSAQAQDRAARTQPGSSGSLVGVLGRPPQVIRGLGAAGSAAVCCEVEQGPVEAVTGAHGNSPVGSVSR